MVEHVDFKFKMIYQRLYTSQPHRQEKIIKFRL